MTAPARCLTTRHPQPVPVRDCRCGWYALRSGTNAWNYYSAERWYVYDDELRALFVSTLALVLPPYVEHGDGWRARQLALLAVVDWPPPDPSVQRWYDTAHAWRAAIARAYGVPLIPPAAAREFGAEW